MSSPDPAPATHVDLVCLGEPLVEFDQREDGSFVQGHGGDTSNCAIAAARMGARVGYVTCLGADPFGDSLMTLWQSQGIDTAHVSRKPGFPTGIYFVTHDRNGHHFTYYRKGSAASNMTAADIPANYIAAAKYLHVSAISQAISKTAAATVKRAMEIANANGTAISYDTNLRLALWPEERARRVIHETLETCQIALPSIDEARLLTGLDRPDRIVDFYLGLGTEVVVLKLGGDGCVIATADSRRTLEGLKVDTVDANGAGDTYAGTFLAGLASGLNPFDAGSHANRVAAISTTTAGAASSIPTRDQISRYPLSTGIDPEDRI